MTKKTVKVKFVDYWPDLTRENNFFLKMLEKHYWVEISDNPDIVFYSCFGVENLKYNCKKIFYVGENIAPGYRKYDYSFSFQDTGEKNLYLPHFVEHDHFFDFIDRKKSDVVNEYKESEKNKFCAFLASNKNATERINFVKALMEYKKVNCYGPVLYNMEEKKYMDVNKGGKNIDRRKEKLDIIKNYKFTIAFENKKSYNYVTEKIFQPLLVGSIPIYWGAPNVGDLFNPECYINIDDFDSFDKAIEWIIRVDQDDDLYKSYFEENPLHLKSKVILMTEEKILSKIQNVFDSEHYSASSCTRVRNYSLYFYMKCFLFSKRLVKALVFFVLK